MSCPVIPEPLYHQIYTKVAFLNHGTDRPDPTEPAQECTICQDTCSTTDAANPTQRIKQCGHCFHKDCLFSWLDEHPSCPNCRAKLFEGRTRTQREGVLLSRLPANIIGNDYWCFDWLLRSLSEEELDEFRAELLTLSRNSRDSRFREDEEEEVEIASGPEMIRGEMVVRRASSRDDAAPVLPWY